MTGGEPQDESRGAARERYERIYDSAVARGWHFLEEERFQLGTDQDTWYDAEAEVARIIEGWREGDPGYALGLRFTHIDLSTRLVLAERLVGTPPPVPQRAVRYLPPARA